MQSNDFSHFIRTQLNENQQSAVFHQSGPLLVVAGAGSGKTRVITSRIIHLLSQGVLPTAIVALTFTNKAAQEMRERITRHFDTIDDEQGFQPSQRFLPFIGTFHSYCLQLLKTNPHLLKHPDFTLMDGDDQLKLVQTIINRMAMGKKLSARQIAYQISKAKNGSDISPDPIVRTIWQRYEAEKEASHILDFDDLLLEALKLFQKNKEFKARFHERVRHLLVDEYQDTNVTQHALLKEMALDKKEFAIDSLCAVGDEDQSIYSWRGATVANMLNFKKDFANTATFTIDQNYRSAQVILDVANHVITHNKHRNPKTLWSDKKGSDRIRALSCLSGYQEADLIAQFLKASVAAKTKLSEIAILYRAHYQSRSIEEALIKQSIAYRIVGGIQFYERAEIKDLLAYLRLVVNPFDRISFFRVVNTPARGLGEKFEELVHETWDREPLLSFQPLCELLMKELPKAKQAGLQSFLTIFQNFTHQETPLSALEKIIAATSYHSYLDTTQESSDAQAKKENIRELLQAVSHFQAQGITTISGFLQEVALMQEHLNDQDEKTDRVQLMTLHAAKGLEFPTVIITGLEEGVLPSSRTLQEPQELEEERRLFYVGITRAEERLLLTSSRFRQFYGKMEMQAPSRFLSEVPQQLLHEEDCSTWRISDAHHYFTRWLQGSGITTPYSGASRIESLKVHATKSVKPSAAKVSHASEESETSYSVWKKNRPVKHPTFGVGIIQKVEIRSDGGTNITVQFRAGEKKIDGKFLSPV
jgi:DNA helicase II / ATP-dependent DNA helicase PcrA